MTTDLAWGLRKMFVKRKFKALFNPYEEGKKKKKMKSCIYLTLLYLWGRKRAAARLVWWQKAEQEISVGNQGNGETEVYF